MKSKLAPISQRVIHAHLYDIVNKSNGDIKEISVVKALGAASVAQALKCIITKKDGSEINCVVKILRPDATMRAQREFNIFNDAAKEIGNGTTTLDSDEQTIAVTKAAKPALKPTLLTLAGGKGSIPTTAAHGWISRRRKQTSRGFPPAR